MQSLVSAPSSRSRSSPRATISGQMSPETGSSAPSSSALREFRHSFALIHAADNFDCSTNILAVSLIGYRILIRDRKLGALGAGAGSLKVRLVFNIVDLCPSVDSDLSRMSLSSSSSRRPCTLSSRRSIWYCSSRTPTSRGRSSALPTPLSYACSSNSAGSLFCLSLSPHRASHRTCSSYASAGCGTSSPRRPRRR